MDVKSLQELAQRQGLILVRVSPRRCLVARLQTVSGYWLDMSTNTYHTNMEAETVFGVSSFAECKKWLAENTEPVPEDLRK